MNRNTSSKLLRSLIVIFSVACASAGNAAPNASSHTPGAACHAANLNQALQGLNWNQFRIYNTSTRPLFVACPVVRGISAADSDDDDNIVDFGGQIAVWYDNGATQEVTCVWREMPSTAAINSEQIAFVGTAPIPVTLPGVGFIFLDLGSMFQHETSPVSYQTVVCKLPPNTGINTMEIFANDAPIPVSR